MTKPKKTPRLIDLMRFITTLSPRYREPTHLEPVVDLFRRIARGEEVHAVVTKPPRHLGTETVLNGALWCLKQEPELRIGWASYADTLSSRVGRKALALASRARIPLDRSVQSASDWMTGRGDGGWFGTSVGGPSVG